MATSRPVDSYTQYLVDLGLLTDAKRTSSSMRRNQRAKQCTGELGKFARTKAQVHGPDHWKNTGVLSMYATEFAQDYGPSLFNARGNDPANSTASAAVWPADQLL